jgi:hypothetical protein
MDEGTSRTVARMNVLLRRFVCSPLGTVGKLYVGGLECYTIENPWLNNILCESCIPIGEYTMKLGMYNRGGYPAWELLEVPGRSLIKIHRGNTMKDLLGCIAPGQGLAIMNDLLAVTNSRRAYEEFMEATEGHTIAAIKVVNTFTAGEMVK